MKKAGTVALVGRPNVGKSTLLNNILGQKVAITSPKPQTTRFPLQAVYEDDRGQIIFIDTPGIYTQSEDKLAQTVNAAAESIFTSHPDAFVYLIDYSRERSSEENKVLGLVRKVNVPVILCVNKTDIKKTDYSADYAFYEDEFKDIIKISALYKQNLNLLINRIFELLPKRNNIVDTTKMVQPALNLDSKLFIAEIIREKVFLFMREEVPYTVNTHVEEIIERQNDIIYIKSKIITTAVRYKIMLIGHAGAMIKEISTAVRKELETATNKKIFVDLTVEVDPHWQVTL